MDNKNYLHIKPKCSNCGAQVNIMKLLVNTKRKCFTISCFCENCGEFLIADIYPSEYIKDSPLDNLCKN